MNLTIKNNETLLHVPLKWNLEINCKPQSGDNSIISIHKDQQNIINISQTGQLLKAEILFDANTTPICLQGKLPECESLSILITNTLNRIALYINEKLWDEDWPLGNVPLENSKCMLCNGEANIHDDFFIEQKYLIKSSSGTIQDIRHWRPDGLNTGAGDCMPFYHDGTFHLFYLFDRRGHGSKWGLGAHQWAHISTKDLISWKQHPMAISIDEQYEGSICTGSVIFHEGLFYAYYAVRMSDRSPAKLTWSVSSDCIHFKKTQKFFTLQEPYEPVSARDPFVFQDADGLFHMLITTTCQDVQKGTKNGCLAHLTSNDLQVWEQTEPFILLDIEDQPECSDYFYYKGWYYLIFSNYGAAHYRMSKTPFGPWIKPENDRVGFEGYRVPKTAKFNGSRVITAGFVVTPPVWYGGEVVFLEAMQNRDGTLHFETPGELMGD